MHRKKTLIAYALATTLPALVLVAGCDTELEDEGVRAADLVTYSAEEDDVLARVQATIQAAPGLQRHEIDTSVAPAAEIVTDDGVYVAIMVDDDGSPGVFEFVPEEATSVVAELDPADAVELFERLSPGAEVPDALYHALPFQSFTEQEIALPHDPDQGLSEVTPVPEEPFISGLGCQKKHSNDFYDDYRPGAYHAESDPEYDPYYGSYRYPEARRKKHIQDFFQTNYSQSTPGPTWGGHGGGYLRASALNCEGGNMTLTWYKCRATHATKDNGCGYPGSNIHTTYGPYSWSSKGSRASYYGTENGSYVLRARLTNVSSGSEQAFWSYFAGSYNTATQTDCFY